MDDKLIRLARKVKTLEDELSKITQIKDLEGLLFVNTDITNKYKKAINETVNIYKDYISNTEKELTNSIQTIKKEHREKTVADTKQIQLLEKKIAQIKEDIQKVCTSIDKSIEDIQKDILKDIKDKNTQILNEIGKKDKELKEVKTKNASLVKDLKALKELVGKLELQKGDDGKSAYDIACELGFKGTKEEWIKSLHGKDGQDIELRGLRAFSDVKNDNKMYARKNKKWVEVENYDDTEIREDIEELQEENETQTEQIQALQTENTRLKATLPTTTGTGENITLSNTAELEFIQPPLPRGNSEQVQYSGKNLINFGSGTQTGNNVLVTKSGSELNFNGTTTGANIVCDINIGKLEAGTYTISKKVESGTYPDTVSNASYLRKASDLSNIINLEGINVENSVSLTLSEETELVFRVYVNSKDKVFNNLTVDLQIEQGTTATVYEPYCGGTASPNPSFPQPITNVTGDVEVLVQNKNFFDKNNANILQAYINSTTKTIINLATARTLFIGCKPNTTYTVSRKAGQRFIVMSTIEIPSYNIVGTIEKHNNTATKLTITTGANDKYLAVFYYLSTADTITEQEILDSIQIEQNSTATTYTPHKEQTFTFPLGTQRMYLGDYLADDGIHHVRGQVVLDGTLNWQYSNGVFYRNSGVFPTNYKLNQSLLSNYFGYGGIATNTTTAYQNGNNKISLNSSDRTSLYIRCDNITSVVDFKTWLGTHNVTVEYELATEEITPYTTEQQQAYNEIKQALSYEEQTNISGTSDEANPLFSVEAYQSIKLVLAG